MHPGLAVRADQWLAHGTLNDTEKRSVSFEDNSAEPGLRCTSVTVSFPSIRAIPRRTKYTPADLYNIWRTAFDVTDTAFPCTLNRTAEVVQGRMEQLNHFLDTRTTIVDVQSLVPDRASLN
ncbi:hypothetical protein FS749_009003 [Ceratobasidium sp. UAMH 11750]|nr:hypothetical protein FS749_009003 [Ceratobasidium sp. UAMH 11750]